MQAFSWLSQSPESPFSEVVRRIQMVAPSMLPIIVLGETGVGKEVVARAIHQASPRCHAPFVAVNCGALNPNLLEGALFGALRGAYTSSYQESKGMIRAADGGTLFLDEIGELPLDAQSRLLRVLQEKRVTPLGGYQDIAVDFRLVCATHRNLQNAVARKTFREDLFFRIHAFPIRIAPLRERPQDIIPLASHMWQDLESGKSLLEAITSYEDRAAMIRFPWPGNVRQLKNVLERFGLLRDYGVSLQAILSEETTSFSLSAPKIQYDAIRLRNRHAPEQIIQALRANPMNRALAARTLGISRGSLNYQMRKFGLEAVTQSKMMVP